MGSSSRSRKTSESAAQAEQATDVVIGRKHGSRGRAHVGRDFLSTTERGGEGEKGSLTAQGTRNGKSRNKRRFLHSIM